jgi:hypothetical protein
MPVLKLYNDSIKEYSLALEKVSRSAFPVAVRQTLNEAAFDVKKNTMIEQSDKAFIKRKPTFFKATSTANPAKGFDVATMKSEVGFVAPSGIKESGHATKDLEEQEYGGDIDKRAFIATKGGRSGRGNVREKMTMALIKKQIINGRKGRGKTAEESFIKSAIHAGVGGFVIGPQRNSQGNRALLLIQSIKRRGRDTVVKSKQIYSVKGKRKAHVKATHFMEKAADESAAKMNVTFVRESEKFWNRMQMKNRFPPIKP